MRKQGFIALLALTGILGLIAVCLLLKAAVSPSPAQPSVPVLPPEAMAHFPRKGPPQPGDWLARFKERGQTVEEYRTESTNQKTDERSVIRIQPMGRILENHRDVIELLREYVEIFYDCPTEIVDPIPMPKEAFASSRNQYNASLILRDRRPGKTLATVFFCEEDIFVDNMNFVFGIGQMHQRLGVYSLARYGDKSARAGGEPIFLKRTLKVATHEIGHLLCLEHCIRYECNMNGSNSLSEMDREPMYLCPECIEKARWCTGFDVRERYLKLTAFYDKVGLATDAAFARRLTSLTKYVRNFK